MVMMIIVVMIMIIIGYDNDDISGYDDDNSDGDSGEGASPVSSRYCRPRYCFRRYQGLRTHHRAQRFPSRTDSAVERIMDHGNVMTEQEIIMQCSGFAVNWMC